MIKNLPIWLKSAKAFTAATGGPTREDTYSITVAVADPQTGALILYGVWDKMTGGVVDSDGVQYYPGAMAPPVSLGGRRTVSNVVVTRLYRLGRDHDVIGKLYDGVGSSIMIVTKQPLDLDGNTYGRPIVYNGVLKTVTAPDVDSDAAATPGLIILEMTVTGFPSA